MAEIVHHAGDPDDDLDVTFGGGEHKPPSLRLTIGVVAFVQVVIGIIGVGITFGVFRSQLEANQNEIVQLRQDLKTMRDVDNRQSDRQVHRLEVLMEESRSELFHLRALVENRLYERGEKGDQNYGRREQDR